MSRVLETLGLQRSQARASKLAWFTWLAVVIVAAIVLAAILH